MHPVPENSNTLKEQGGQEDIKIARVLDFRNLKGPQHEVTHKTLRYRLINLKQEDFCVPL